MYRVGGPPGGTVERGGRMIDDLGHIGVPDRNPPSLSSSSSSCRSDVTAMFAGVCICGCVYVCVHVWLNVCTLTCWCALRFSLHTFRCVCVCLSVRRTRSDTQRWLCCVMRAKTGIPVSAATGIHRWCEGFIFTLLQSFIGTRDWFYSPGIDDA